MEELVFYYNLISSFIARVEKKNLNSSASALYEAKNCLIKNFNIVFVVEIVLFKLRLPTNKTKLKSINFFILVLILLSLNVKPRISRV